MSEVGALREAVDGLVASDPGEMDDDVLDDLLVEVCAQADRLAAVRARVISEHDRRTAWRPAGYRSEKEFLRDRCRMSAGQAAGVTDTARRLATLPKTSAAWTDGTLGEGAARVVTRAVQDLPADALEGLDDLVLGTAAAADAATMRTAVDEYCHRVDSAALADREERAWRARRLSITNAGDGSVLVNGRLDPVGGEVVLTALASLAAPGAATDARTAEQRRADALVGLARRQLDVGDLPETGGVRPHVTLVAPVATLADRPGAPPALLDRVGAVCSATARLLTCDAGVARVLLDGASQPLDAGRETRVVSAAQRRALVARDGGCIGCGAPAGWCEAHHVVFWADGGPTDLDNLVLLCWGCHRDVHHRGWHPVRGPDHRWRLHAPPLREPSPVPAFDGAAVRRSGRMLVRRRWRDDRDEAHGGLRISREARGERRVRWGLRPSAVVRDERRPRQV